MPFIPVPNAAKVAATFTQYGQHLVNTLWFEGDTPFDGDTLNSLATAINSWVITEMLPHMSSSVVFNGTEARAMDTSSSPGVLVPVTSGNVGAISGNPLPSGVTAAIKFLTGLTGRSFRGRNYYIGLTGSAVSGDSLIAGVDADLVGIYDSLGSYLLDLGVQHIVASLFSGVDAVGHPVPRTTGVTTPVISYAMDLDLDSQRRRLKGRGN